MSTGIYWKNKFMQKLTPIMYAMVLHKYDGVTSQCPSALNDRYEFDVEADTLYHQENPTADICNGGIIGTVVAIDIKGFYFESLTESQMAMLNVGTLNENEGVFIVDGFTDLTGAICIEYPTGIFYQIIFMRDLKVGEEIITKYGKCKISTGIL